MYDNKRYGFKATIYDGYDEALKEPIHRVECGVTENEDASTAVDKIFQYYGDDLIELTFYPLSDGVAFFISEKELERIIQEG